MPVRHSPENVADGNARHNDNRCSLYNTVMNSETPCITTRCKHTFHQNGLITWLTDKQECPTCHIPRQPQELKSANRGQTLER